MQKRALINHGWNGSPSRGWIPWVKKELEKNDFEVKAPKMPDAKNPKANDWLKHLNEQIGEPDENLYLVGHSLGCISVLRYIESLKEDQKIGGAVLVAGFTSHLGMNELKNFFETDIDWQRIRDNAKQFTVIHSTNDPYVSLHYGDIFEHYIKAKKIIKDNMGHFSFIDGTNELPDVLNSIITMSKK